MVASPMQSAGSLTVPQTQLMLSAPPVYAPPVSAHPVYEVRATERPSTPRGRPSEPVVDSMERPFMPVPATEPLSLSGRSQPPWQSLRVPVQTVQMAQPWASSPPATRAVSPATRVAAATEPIAAAAPASLAPICQVMPGGIFKVDLQTGGRHLGVTVDPSLAISAIDDGPLKEHNARAPQHAVWVGDRFVAINGRDVSTQQEYFSATSGCQTLCITVARGVQADVLSLSRASRAASSRASSVATLPPDMIGLAGEFWRIFREVDVGQTGALQWNTSEIRRFVIRIFEHLGLPRPTFADHLWYQWFIDVDRNRNGNLEFAEAVEFARYVLQQAVRLKGDLSEMGPQQPRSSSPPASRQTIVVSPGQTTPHLPVVGWMKPQTWTQLPTPHVQAPMSKLNIDGAASAQPIEPVTVMRPSVSGSIRAH